jgi:hypothetical protein
MPFKENLLKKIHIDALTRKVLTTIGPSGSEQKVDRKTMRELLGMGPFHFKKERDLDLYIRESESGKNKILVLDNELAIYLTTPEDVALRKSPTIKEMISIRNAVKILNDKDVVASKREVSVMAVRADCMGLLNLSYTAQDLDEIEAEGIAALETRHETGVITTLSLFDELLGFDPAPKAFEIKGCRFSGRIFSKAPGEILLGPLVVWNMTEAKLQMIPDPVSTLDKEKVEWVKQVALGTAEAPLEGPDVLKTLRNMAGHSKYNPMYFK